jgi:hypothetical protein
MEYFNKWGISVATKYFNPIMALSTLIEVKIINKQDVLKEYELCQYGMSHSGNVMTAFNENFKNNSTPQFKIKLDTDKIFCLEFFKYLSYASEDKKYRPNLLIILKDNKLKFKFINKDFSLDENFNITEIYKTINEFILDFNINYKKD